MIRFFTRGMLIMLAFLYSQTYAQDQVLSKIGKMLQEKHYLHPQIDDAFSAGLWESYLQQLDPGRNIFLQSDIENLSKYKTSLDDEIKGRAAFAFYPEAIKCYAIRYEQAADLWRACLAKSIYPNSTDRIYPVQVYDTYPKDVEDQQKRWQQTLSITCLEKYNAVKLERKNSKVTDSVHKLTDVELQKVAREKVLKQKLQQLLRFKKKTDDVRLTDYLNAITLLVDPHTAYFSYSDKQAFDQSMANRFFGIGVQLREDENGVVIIQSIDPAGPCWKNGQLAVGDAIIGVGEDNGLQMVDVEGYGVMEATKYIRGKQGTSVQLKCRKSDGGVFTTSMVREEIKTEEAFASSALVKLKDKKIGYLNLPLFYDDFSGTDGAHCADDVERELKKLMKENIDGLVIDLRNNGGGSLGQVIKMTGLFIGTGPVVQVRDGNGRIQVLSSNRAEALYTGPLSVLVNELSASASEIFAAAIQDYQRGIIIGSQTLGKGTVQQTLGLGAEKDGAVKLTIQKFYRINGGSTQIRGITPDVQLPDAYALLNVREVDRPNAMDWDRIEESNFKKMDTKILDNQIDKRSQIVKSKKNWRVLNSKINSLSAQKADLKNGLLTGKYTKILEARNKINSELSSLTELPLKSWLLIYGAKPSLAPKLVKDPYLKEAVEIILRPEDK